MSQRQNEIYFHFGTPILFPERVLIMNKLILIDGGQREHCCVERAATEYCVCWFSNSQTQQEEKLIMENVKINWLQANSSSGQP